MSTDKPRDEFEFSEMRKKLSAAHLEIIKSRQYRGTREHDVVAWLADYVEKNFVEASSYQSLQEKYEKSVNGLKQIMHKAQTDKGNSAFWAYQTSRGYLEELGEL